MTDGFWQAVDAQLAAVRALPPEAGADALIRLLDAPSAGDAFFAGSGGGDQLRDALGDAGWDIVWAEWEHYYVARAPNGDLITYCEGDVYRGNTAIRDCRHTWVAGMMRVGDEDLDAVYAARAPRGETIDCERCDAVYAPVVSHG